jgi:hypothetical protein
MFATIYSYFHNPKYASIIVAAWTLLVIYGIYHLGGFNEKFLHFGPTTDPNKQSTFLNIKLDSWKKVIIVMVFSFFSQIFVTYGTQIIMPWITNIIQDPKTKTINVSKYVAQFVSNSWYLVRLVNQILSVLVYVTMQLQFILPAIVGQIITTLLTTTHYLSTKKVVA